MVELFVFTFWFEGYVKNHRSMLLNKSTQLLKEFKHLKLEIEIFVDHPFRIPFQKVTTSNL